MTIDHDALARRIAERLGLSGYLHAPERLNGVWRATKQNVEQSIAATLREALPTSEAKCEWTQDAERYDRWNTACKRCYLLDVDGPADHFMHYCCFCGKKLVEAPFNEQEDEDA